MGSEERTTTQTVRPAPNSQKLARVPIEYEVLALNLEKQRPDARRKSRLGVALPRSPIGITPMVGNGGGSAGLNEQ